MHLCSLHIYPLKGGAALNIDTAEVGPKGLRYDRVLMAVDPTSKSFLTQREIPRLVLVQSVPDSEGVKLAAPEFGELRLRWSDLEDAAADQVQLWRDRVDIKYASDEASQWLSEFLRQKVWLGYQPQNARREVNPTYASGAIVSFADGYPILVAFSASLTDLNQRLAARGQKPVPMDRFRPNLVIHSESAWQEDHIEDLSIGNMRLRLVKPCTRCVVTTVNQQSAIKESGEPLRTLATFRTSPHYKGALFAENAVALDFGQLHIGDGVEILSRREQALSFVVRG